MKYLIAASLLAFAGSVLPPVHAEPSYACHNSKTAAELVVCDSGELSRLDRQLNRAYARSDTPVWRQRAWLRQRNNCGLNERCIRRLYVNRIQELRRYAE